MFTVATRKNSKNGSYNGHICTHCFFFLFATVHLKVSFTNICIGSVELQ